jgi:mono/diheme cytochrome c family protein
MPRSLPFARSATFAAATVTCATVLGAWVTVAAQQQRSAADGVYSPAQAARGARLWEVNCQGCHREPGGNAPVLAGERFTRIFGDGKLQAVFTSMKTTMPRQAPGSLTDAEYVDIVAHLLKASAFAEGPAELGVADLGAIVVPGTAGAGGSLDQALVQVAGCLSRSGRNWTLTSATAPARTRAPEAPGDDEAAQLDGLLQKGPAGSQTFRLQQVYSAPTGWTDQRVAARGFLSEGAEPRITVTSMRVLTSRCQP